MRAAARWPRRQVGFGHLVTGRHHEHSSGEIRYHFPLKPTSAMDGDLVPELTRRSRTVGLLTKRESTARLANSRVRRVKSVPVLVSRSLKPKSGVPALSAQSDGRPLDKACSWRPSQRGICQAAVGHWATRCARLPCEALLAGAEFVQQPAPGWRSVLMRSPTG